MDNALEKAAGIMTALAGMADMRGLIQTAVRLLAEAIGAQDGAYLRYRGEMLHLHTGLHEDTSPVLLDIAAALLRTDETTYINTTESIMAVRLKGPKTTFGVLVLRSSHGFQDSDLHLATLVSSKIEDAIHIARLQQTERKYSRFTMDLSREIRSPLTPLIGYTDLMLMGGAGEMNEMQRVFLRNIRDGADRILVLVNGILNISRLDAGETLAMNIERVNVADLLAGTLQQCLNRPHHARKNMNTSLHIADAVNTVEADHEKLVQIMTAIMDNALDYTKPGGRVDVLARLTDDGRHLLIQVQDSGVGIPPEMKDSVWQRFERYEEDAVALGVVGTGLGLTLVRELVRLHRGKAWFDSERGKGTTFYVQLPLKQV
jgi:signal transduction histidine kinase